MRYLAANNTGRQAGAISSGALLSFAVLGVLLGLLALAALQYLNRQQRVNLSRQMGELESQKEATNPPPGRETFALTVAKAKQEEALTELRKATNLLEKVSAEATRFFKLGDTLATNESAARQFFVKAVESMPTLSQIRVKLAEIEPAIVQVESARGTEYLPDPRVVFHAKKSAEWASTTSEAVRGFQNRLEEILRDIKTELPTAAIPAPSPQPERAPDTVESSRILVEMKAEAERILAETKAEAARILDETQDRADRILAETQKKADAILVATKERPPVQETAPVAVNPKTPPNTAPAFPEAKPIERPRVSSESSSAEFQQLIENPKMRTQLAAFTTPGNMRLPGMFRAQREPISLSQLKSFGALEPDTRGLGRLVEIATTPQDAVRPRWKFKTKKGVWQRKPDEVAQARIVQQLFIDLGSDFVAAGLLAE